MANARTFAQVLWFDAGNQQHRAQQSRQHLSRIPESRVLHVELSDLQSDLGRAAPRVFFWGGRQFDLADPPCVEAVTKPSRAGGFCNSGPVVH